MQKRAGILFLSKSTGRVLMILDEGKWTVPTFSRSGSLLEDSLSLISSYYSGTSKILPIELYISDDKGFEYGTYICLVEEEFLTTIVPTICWCDLNNLPKNLHVGLKNTLTSSIIKAKIETVLALNDA